MIKKIILGILFLILILFSNFGYIKSFYFNSLGEYYFDKNNIEKSKNNFENAGTESAIYNLGNLYYKSYNYNLAIKKYESILNTKSKSLLFKINHNLGNSYFRMGEIDIQNRLDYFNTSAGFYNDALKIHFNNETKNNFEFVLEKIKELEKNTEDNSDSNSSNKKDENSDNTDDSINSEIGLTNDQKEKIKEYQEILKKEQNSNSDSFNKIYEGDGNYSVYENIYDNNLIENKVEKDW